MLHAVLTHDAVGGQGRKIVLPDALVVRGHVQNVRDGGFADRAPALREPKDTGNDFLRFQCGIDQFKICQAVGAVVARERRLFVEVFENETPQAVGCGRVKDHLPQAFAVAFDEEMPGALVQFLVVMPVLNEEFAGAHITRAVQQDAVRRGASRPARPAS